MGPPLITQQVSNLLVVHFISHWKLNHALKVGQLHRSSDVSFSSVPPACIHACVRLPLTTEFVTVGCSSSLVMLQ